MEIESGHFEHGDRPLDAVYWTQNGYSKPVVPKQSGDGHLHGSFCFRHSFSEKGAVAIVHTFVANAPRLFGRDHISEKQPISVYAARPNVVLGQILSATNRKQAAAMVGTKVRTGIAGIDSSLARARTSSRAKIRKICK